MPKSRGRNCATWPCPPSTRPAIGKAAAGCATSQTGDFFDVDANLFRLKSSDAGRPTCLVFLHRRIDDRASLCAALAEAQARKRAILESSLDPIITINHEGVITEFNKAAEQTFGHPREKVLGSKPSDVLFPAAASAGEQDRINRYLDVGEGSLLGRRVEVTAVRANGDTFDAEMAMTISHEQGAPVLTFFIRDVSRRKKAEQEQSRYAAELERSNRELEQFAYVASHDLQEPLRKIRTFGDRLQMKCADKLDEVGTDCLLRMQSAAERMQTLIDGLLSLSRVTTQGQNFVVVDLAEIAREVVSDLEVQIEKVGGQVEVGHLPAIQADPLQMRQLLQNLIANGLKFHRVDQPPVVKVQGRFVHGREHRKPGARPPRNSAGSFSRTTASVSSRSTTSGFSASSSGCTRATFSRAWESGWRCAARSSSGTAERSPPEASPAREACSRFCCRWPTADRRVEGWMNVQ